jgi:hypothetical protein
MNQVISLRFWINQDIIKVYLHKVIDLIPKHMRHHALKSARSVYNQTKGHYHPFVMSILCTKGHLGDIMRSNTHLMKTLLQINFGEILCLTKRIKTLLVETRLSCLLSVTLAECCAPEVANLIWRYCCRLSSLLLIFHTLRLPSDLSPHS